MVFDTVILILKDSFRLRLMLKKMNPQVFRFSCGFFLCLTMYAINLICLKNNLEVKLWKIDILLK